MATYSSDPIGLADEVVNVANALVAEIERREAAEDDAELTAKQEAAAKAADRAAGAVTVEPH